MPVFINPGVRAWACEPDSGEYREMVQTQSEIAREVGRRIQKIRASTGVSARVLAECADMDLTNFQRIERGIGNPTIATLVQIATALEIDVAELVTGLDPNDLPHGREPYGYSQAKTRRRAYRAVY